MTAVSGGLVRLVSVYLVVGRFGSCWPSVSTASPWTRNEPPSGGAGTVADQEVEVPPGITTTTALVEWLKGRGPEYAHALAEPAAVGNSAATVPVGLSGKTVAVDFFD